MLIFVWGAQNQLNKKQWRFYGRAQKKFIQKDGAFPVDRRS